LNNMIKEYAQDREDMDILFINYNNVLSDPKENISKILKFLSAPNDLLDKMTETVDSKLYRQRRA
ncbi:MAG: sulfotransferase domain-containing protein, partial [Thermoplasmatales archaeon]|nr:sulfotransferase domain-containing protein [Thermoplasmatales archaeon]